MKKIRLGMLLLVSLLAIQVTMAGDCTTDFIVNGSFEEPIVPLGVGLENPTPAECSWTTSSGAYSIIVDDIVMSGNAYPLPPDGFQTMYWTGGKLTQNTGLTIEAGSAYKLSFKLLSAVVDNPSQYVFAAFEDEIGNMIAFSDSFMPVLPKLTWTEFTFTLNTASHPESVGKKLVVALYSAAYVYVDMVKLTVGPAGDLNGDCVCDIADLGVFVSNWLQSNKVEQSQY